MATNYAAQAISITAGTLAHAAARESAAIVTDTTKNVVDYRVTVKPTLAAGTPAGNQKAVFIWVKTSSDGTNWDGNSTNADAAITLDAPHQFFLAAIIPFQTNAARGVSFSLKAACGGSVPKNWGIIIENQTGLAFASLAAAAQLEHTV